MVRESVFMGNKRLNQINRDFGPNEPCLNPHSEETLLLQKVNRAAAKRTQQHTVVMRKVRKLTKQIKKIQRNDYIRAKSRLFGFWYYWFVDGKIGTEEAVEPNLLANVLRNKNLETLLERYELHG
jgi:hypothetical protein